MVDSGQSKRDLKMVEDHEGTAEQGAGLLAATGTKTDSAGDWGMGPDARAGRQLHIRVTDIVTGRTKASVQIPVALMDAGIKIGAQFAPEVPGIDMTSALEAIRGGATGQIIDVTDEATGERLEISVE